MNKKTVLITGGAKGIGRAIAIDYINSGYNVCITYNTSLNQAEELNKEYNIDIFKVDINNIEEINNCLDSVIEKYGKIDTLVNNAGICQEKLFTDITISDWNNMISTNLTGMFSITQAAISKSMMTNKDGSIINISSVWGITGGSCEVHYSASKAGVIGFTKALSKELALSNITVNCIAPGAIQTDMLNIFSKEDIDNIKDEIPMGRIGKIEDISGMCVFLSSDKARYITGQVINIDGGMCS